MSERQILSELPAAVTLPTLELPTEDGIPLESPWHRAEINLLIDVTRTYWHDRTDFYTGGNMFIYFSLVQARQRDYRGPDFFIVTDVDGRYQRDAWVVWEENGRYPDLIIELLSPSTADVDKTVKKTLYERTFRTSEYYCYDPASQELSGWHLQGQQYVPLTPGPHGRLWSNVLQLWLGTYEGVFLREEGIWLRFFDHEGQIVPTAEESVRTQAEAEHQRAEAERQRAEAERQRAEAAEAELTRLRARLAALEGPQPG
jgi:Uma2 family endonuclease